MTTSGYKQGFKEAKTGKSDSKAHEGKESSKFKAAEKKGEKAAMKRKKSNGRKS